MNLARELVDTARRYGPKPAVIFENRIYTFGEFDAEVERCAGLLRGLGITKGDRVALQLPKCMEFVSLHLAALSIGAVTLPLNPAYTPAELDYFLRDSGAALFVTDEAGFRRARNVLDSIRGLLVRLIDGSDETADLALGREPTESNASSARDYPTGPDDMAVICYTSGTTGRSKGAMITHRNLVTNMRALNEAWHWTAEDILLHALPLFHVHGLFVALHGGLYAGSTIAMLDAFESERVWKTIEAERCTIFMGVPTMYRRLTAAWDALGRTPDLSSMRVFISGSAPLSETLFHRFEHTTGFRILERYGMTETGMNTSNRIDPADRIPKSVGFPLPGVEIRVVDSEMNDLPPDKVGEVLIRGHNVFGGYWSMPDKTAESFNEGWFTSGDLGYLDGTGRLFLVGRAKELIITGGYNVYPKEIENVLDGVEGVRESAVVGLPDEDFGERVTAVVVAESNAVQSEEVLIRLCKERLAGYKCPKNILFVDALPRNAMGKILKHELVERLGTAPGDPDEVSEYFRDLPTSGRGYADSDSTPS